MLIDVFAILAFHNLQIAQSTDTWKNVSIYAIKLLHVSVFHQNVKQRLDVVLLLNVIKELEEDLATSVSSDNLISL